MLLAKIKQSVQCELTEIPGVKRFIKSYANVASGVADKFGVFPLYLLGLIFVLLLVLGLIKLTKKSERV